MLHVHQHVGLLYPNLDFRCPTETWTDTEWSESHRGICIDPFQACLIAYHAQKLINLPKLIPPSHLTKPTIIAVSSKLNICLDDVQKKLANPTVQSIIDQHPDLRCKDPKWWLSHAISLRECLLCICDINNEPLPDTEYPMEGVSKKFVHCLYIHRMIRLQDEWGVYCHRINDKWRDHAISPVVFDPAREIIRVFCSV